MADGRPSLFGLQTQALDTIQIPGSLATSFSITGLCQPSEVLSADGAVQDSNVPVSGPHDCIPAP